MARIQDLWNNRVKCIPQTADQRLEAAKASALNENIFSEFGLFTTIDGLVSTYPAYKHDDVYKFETYFVIDLDIMSRKKTYQRARDSEARQKSS